jgi:hypothetical protein
MTVTAEHVGVVVGIAVPVFSLIAWAMRAIVAPLRVTVENNTKVMEKWGLILEKHQDELEDHAVRITKIETVHEIEREEGGL